MIPKKSQNRMRRRTRPVNIAPSHTTKENGSPILSYRRPWLWIVIFGFLYSMVIFFALPSPSQKHRKDSETGNSNSEGQRQGKAEAGARPEDAPPHMKIIGRHPYDEKWETDPSAPINSADVTAKLIPLHHPWGTIYTHRIACMVLSLWPDRKEKWDLIIDTFGSGCTQLFFVLDEESHGPKEYRGYPTLNIHMKRVQNNEIKGGRNIWEKVHRMWSHVYSSSMKDDFDWFIKADDDTFIMTENMHGLLQFYDPDMPWYVGHTLRSRWERENIIFNSGICYVLSRGAIEKIGPYISHLPSLPAMSAKSHCIDRQGAGEDPTMGACMSGVGIRPTNTMDRELRERFLIFRPEDHAKIFREDTWFWKYKSPEVKEGPECCSPYIVCAHNYKRLHEAKEIYPKLQKKYNGKKDWSKIELPPRPRTFIYDASQVNFEIDDWFNVQNPPRGQRVYKGEGKEWQCAGCQIGDPKDIYWTTWWDGVEGRDEWVIPDSK